MTPRAGLNAPDGVYIPVTQAPFDKLLHAHFGINRDLVHGTSMYILTIYTFIFSINKYDSNIDYGNTDNLKTNKVPNYLAGRVSPEERKNKDFWFWKIPPKH